MLLSRSRAQNHIFKLHTAERLPTSWKRSYSPYNNACIGSGRTLTYSRGSLAISGAFVPKKLPPARSSKILIKAFKALTTIGVLGIPRWEPGAIPPSSISAIVYFGMFQQEFGDRVVCCR
ncbi:hypothetical protein Tco_1474057 [Tanacetum coccineum]